MDGGAQVAVVDGADGVHLLVGKRRQFSGADVAEQLFAAAGAWDDGADGVVHEDPAQRVWNEIVGAKNVF